MANFIQIKLWDRLLRSIPVLGLWILVPIGGFVYCAMAALDAITPAGWRNDNAAIYLTLARAPAE